MAEQPGTLPAKLYLLAYDPERSKLTGRHNLDLLLTAGALAELLQRGLLRDLKGRAVATGAAPADLAPVLADLLAEIAERRPHSWKHWVTRRRGLGRIVQRELAATGLLRLEPYRVLGLFTATRVELRDPRPRKALLAAFSAALRGPLSQVEPQTAALVALADAARLGLLLNRRQRREHRERIGQLAARCEPVPGALRAAIRARDSATAAS
ncbi:GPP34 family phosphoprotein [Streptomyces tateyamensis]|uniref:GPP34 family phosphoprotein n=1 Tax=Streptomyces tateyamensis TaxID=565073 RepID=A0A2V4N3J1_9ACTN|nr:GPP34 family phosphoprotein [Streptomyces tateyamensis]PYC73955.1 GPP34 family phosphoprotein [Streptomyces tateyamensis]